MCRSSFCQQRTAYPTLTESIPFCQWLETSNVNPLFLRPQTSVYAQKRQPAHFLGSYGNLDPQVSPDPRACHPSLPTGPQWHRSAVTAHPPLPTHPCAIFTGLFCRGHRVGARRTDAEAAAQEHAPQLRPGEEDAPDVRAGGQQCRVRGRSVRHTGCPPAPLPPSLPPCRTSALSSFPRFLWRARFCGVSVVPL